MSEQVFPVPADWSTRAYIDAAKYDEMYQASISDPESFWASQGKRLDWFAPYSKIRDVSYDAKDFRIRWFYDGVLNVAHNCLDRHLPAKKDDIAFLWEGDEPDQSKDVTYGMLHEMVCRTANVMKTHGVKKGDRVTIYLPMIPEAAAAMLACARIGAIHSVIFAGFSPQSIAGRIQDAESDFVITADQGVRGGKIIPLKANVDEALTTCPGVRHVLVVARTGTGANLQPGRDLVYEDEIKKVSADCPCEPMNAEDALFILYTSGSTGKPKGVLHTTGGYLVWASMTFQYVFDYHPGEIFMCSADIGWVTGHSYVVYGPLANGATSVMFEGTPSYPDDSRFWNVIDKHQVNIFYTAPTAIRALERHGDAPVKKNVAQKPSLAGLRRRADQSGSLALVSSRCRRRPLPDRRHLVAD